MNELPVDGLLDGDPSAHDGVVMNAVGAARRSLVTHLTVSGVSVAAVVPESVISALSAAEDADEEADADAAMDEPGPSLPWEQVKAELEP